MKKVKFWYLKFSKKITDLENFSKFSKSQNSYFTLQQVATKEITHVIFYIFPFGTGKDFKMLKKMLLTSKRHTNHPFHLPVKIHNIWCFRLHLIGNLINNWIDCYINNVAKFWLLLTKSFWVENTKKSPHSKIPVDTHDK